MSKTRAVSRADVAGEIAFHHRETHLHVLRLVESLSDEQLNWRPHAAATSIAFNLWHLARWADFLQATIPSMAAELGHRLGKGRQIWEAEGLAVRWGLAGTDLGDAATGMLLMDDVAAARLPLPGKAALLDYARRAFASAERAVEAIDDALFLAPSAPVLSYYRSQEFYRRLGLDPADPPPLLIGRVVLEHLAHDNRHLGMIDHLLGLQGAGGSKMY